MANNRSIVTFTRPANTTAYSAGKVINAATAQVLTFNVPKAFGLITGFNLKTNNSSAIPACTLYLFQQTFTPLADQASLTLTGTQHSDFIASLTTVASLVASGSGAFANYTGGFVPFTTLTTGSSVSKDNQASLYGLLSISGAYTPTSGQQFTLDLFTQT